MTPPNELVDQLIEDYLNAASRASAGLPAGRRAELVADLREHIAASRAKLLDPSETAVRTILARLGEPTEIAAEARMDLPKDSGEVTRSASIVFPQPAPTRGLSPANVGLVVAVLLVAIVVGAVMVILNGGGHA
jgi:uncharacterized membrane protein